jgi:hypothetical protein
MDVIQDSPLATASETLEWRYRSYLWAMGSVPDFFAHYGLPTTYKYPLSGKEIRDSTGEVM